MRVKVDATPLSQGRRDIVEAFAGAPAGLGDALFHLGNIVAKAQRGEMQAKFDRPTRWALQGIYVQTSLAMAERRATTLRNMAAGPIRPEAVTPSVEVGLKDDRATSNNGIPASYFLEAQIEGGRRRLKAFEKALQAAGAMPTGWRAVPGKFAKLDAFGNINRGQIIQILSQLRITQTAGYTRNKSTEGLARLKSEIKQGGQIFALPNGRGKLLPGVYQAPLQANASTRFKKTDRFSYRQAGQLRMVERQPPRPLLIFVRKTDYRQRFDWWGVADRTINARADGVLAPVLRRITRGT